MAIKCNRCGFLTLIVGVALLIYWRYATFFTAHNEESTTSNHHHDGSAAFVGAGRVSVSALLRSSIAAAQLGGFEVYRLSSTAMQDQLNVRTKGKTLEGANDPVTDADLRSHCAMWRRLSGAHPTIRIVSEEAADNAKCEHIQLLDDALNDDELVDGTAFAIEETASVDDVTVWIDPLDATQEFTEQLHQYVTVMVCVAIRGRPIIGVIHNPFTDDTFWSWNRQSVSSATFAAQPPSPTNRTPAAAFNNAAYNHTVIVSRSHVGTVDTLVRRALGASTAVVHAGGAGYKVLQVAAGKADAYVHSTRIKKWDLCAGNAILEARGGNMTDLHGRPIDYAGTASVVNEAGVLASVGPGHEFYVQRLSNTLASP